MQDHGLQWVEELKVLGKSEETVELHNSVSLSLCVLGLLSSYN